MRYYVLADDGQKYGPADVPTLQAWADEGRLNAQTRLEAEAGGELLAGAVDGLRFPAAAPPADLLAVPPIANSPYPRPGMTGHGVPYGGPNARPVPAPGMPYSSDPLTTGENGNKEVAIGSALGVGALVAAWFLGIGAFFLGIYAVTTGASAWTKGNRLGALPIALGTAAVLVRIYLMTRNR